MNTYTKRTDVHSPSNLVTEDYEYAYCYDSHPEEGDLRFTWPILQDLNKDGWRFGQVHGGDTCDHCGTPLRYVAVLKHVPTHTLIKVGETCLDNRFSLATAEFQKLRKEAKLHRERNKLSDRRQNWIDANQTEYNFLANAHELYMQGGYYNDFLESLFHQLDKKGELSEAQVNAINKGIEREKAYQARKAEEAKNAPKLIPVIEGRGEITGKILSIKWHDNQFGGGLKMTVLDDRGFKVWGSVPGDLDSALVDRYRESVLSDLNSEGMYKVLLNNEEQRVTFTATVTKSEKDESFGFFKRPSKSSLLRRNNV